MTYHFSKTLKTSFEEALERTKEALQKEGFGVMTEIDVKATLKEKLNVDFRAYQIIGACNPPLAYRAIQAEDKIGLLLPCNIIVQELENGEIEVAAFDPSVVMSSVGNPDLAEVGEEAQAKLSAVIHSL